MRQVPAQAEKKGELTFSEYCYVLGVFLNTFIISFSVLSEHRG